MKYETPAVIAALLIGSSSWAAINTSDPAGTTGTNSATQPAPSTVTGSPTGAMRPVPTPGQGSLSQPQTPAMPNPLQNQNQMNPSEAQQRAQAPYLDAEICADNDAACLRRRQDQIDRNTPFQQQTPPTPGVPGAMNPATGTINP